MYQAKEIVQKIKEAAIRRVRILIVVPILFVGLSIGAIYMIEPKYESSTSILVQKEETLNPLVLYEMAVNIASEDRLQSFNEIIYSRSTMEIMIDSLGLGDSITTNSERQKVVESLRNSVRTSARTSDSFEITMSHTDPVIAKEGAEFLANHFIKTRLHLENRRNNETVNFFSEKLQELEELVRQQRNEVTQTTSNRMRDTPMQMEQIRSRLEDVESQISSLDWEIYQHEQQLATLNDFESRENKQDHVRLLYGLSFSDMPLGEDLAEHLREYDELRQQYTTNFPRTRSQFNRVTETTGRIPSILESTIADLTRQREDLASQRNSLIENLQQSFIAAQQQNTQQTDFSIYEGLYSEMRVKLEQARMTRDIGDRGAEQFIVLDPPVVADIPSSPNKPVLLILGLFLGIGVAGIASGLAEVMDTTIRDEEYLEFDKPIIAYLTHGN